LRDEASDRFITLIWSQGDGAVAFASKLDCDVVDQVVLLEVPAFVGADRVFPALTARDLTDA